MQFPTTILAIAFTAIAFVNAQAQGGITCASGTANNILASDWDTAISNLQNNNVPGLDNPFELFATIDDKVSSTNIFFESFSSTISNGFLFESTHIGFSNLAQALQSMKDQCCGSFSTCIGGSTNVLGDTGLPVSVNVHVAQ